MYSSILQICAIDLPPIESPLGFDINVADVTCHLLTNECFADIAMNMFRGKAVDRFVGELVNLNAHLVPFFSAHFL